MTITASEFKAKCLKLMDHVQKSGESISITKRGVEVARLTAPQPKQKPWERLRGTVRVLGDIITPVFNDDEYDAISGRELQHRGLTRTKTSRRATR
jgi:prevent-host-death family protein